MCQRAQRAAPVQHLLQLGPPLVGLLPVVVLPHLLHPLLPAERPLACVLVFACCQSCTTMELSWFPPVHSRLWEKTHTRECRDVVRAQGLYVCCMNSNTEHMSPHVLGIRSGTHHMFSLYALIAKGQHLGVHQCRAPDPLAAGAWGHLHQTPQPAGQRYTLEGLRRTGCYHGLGRDLARWSLSQTPCSK